MGSKNQLDHHEQLINVLGTEMVNQREAREESDRQLIEMKGMLETLLRQVKGKGKQSDPTLERSIAAGGGDGGGNRPPPPQQGAPGAPGGGDSDDDGEGPRKGRRDERPARRSRKPRREEDEEDDDDEGMADPDELRFSRILGRAIRDTSKRPAQPPSEYEHAQNQDVRFWLTACKDFFDRNPSQWRIEADRIKYTLSKMKRPQASSFAMTYQNQMTGELGFTRQEGYALWAIFAQQVVRRFRPTHEEVKALRGMLKVRYKGEIDQFLLEIENWNVKARVTGVAFRKMIDDQIPEEVVRGMSMLDPIADDREWLEGVRTASRAEEDLGEGRKLRYGDSSGLASSGKRKRNEPRVTTAKKPKYTAKENRVYQARKKEEKAAKKPAAPRQEIMHRVWADAHTGIDQKENDEPKAKKQCTRCTLTNHGWKHFKKEIRISTIQRRPFKLLVGRSKPPRPRKPRVAAVSDDSLGESSQQASQRPLAWTYMEDDDP